MPKIDKVEIVQIEILGDELAWRVRAELMHQKLTAQLAKLETQLRWHARLRRRPPK